MEGIPEAREEGERLSRNTSPCLDINTQQQMQNDSYNTVVSNDRISPSLVRDNVMYNKQNEYAVWFAMWAGLNRKVPRSYPC